MTGPFGVHSEVGQLRRAFAHRPGLELSRLTPGNCHDLLFDDAPWADRARQEHDGFAQTLRDHGVVVHHFDELLTRTLQSDDARAFVLDRLCTPELVGPTLAGPLHRLVLSPLPNTLFQRDNTAWIYGGVSVSPMAKAARVRESLNTRAVYRFHPMFARQRPTGRTARPREPPRHGTEPAVPARLPRRADPGHDRLLAGAGPAQRRSTRTRRQRHPGPRRRQRPRLRLADEVHRTRVRTVGGGGHGDPVRLSIALDGTRWRRVVASPDPCRLIEQETVDRLVSSGTTVICGGGEGAPVVDTGGRLAGVEAVVDKDLTAAVLDIAVQADRLLVLTDVPGVMRGFGTSAAAVVRHLDTEQAAGLRLAAGSMGPKVEACRRFVTATGQVANIGALTEAHAVLEGKVGTTISMVASDPAPPTSLLGTPR